METKTKTTSWPLVSRMIWIGGLAACALLWIGLGWALGSEEQSQPIKWKGWFHVGQSMGSLTKESLWTLGLLTLFALPVIRNIGLIIEQKQSANVTGLLLSLLSTALIILVYGLAL